MAFLENKTKKSNNQHKTQQESLSPQNPDHLKTI